MHETNYKILYFNYERAAIITRMFVAIFKARGTARCRKK